MRNSFNKLSTIAAVSLVAVATSGCSSIVERTEAKVNNDAERINKMYSKGFEKVAPGKRNFKQSNDIFINPTPLPSYVSAKKQLPDIFKKTISVTMPQPVPVNEIISEISREFSEKYGQQLTIDVSQDVYNPNGGVGQVLTSGAQTGAAGGAGAGGATGQTGGANAQGAQSINGLNPNQINNVLVDSFIYQGTIEAALNILAQKAGTSWEWNGSSVEFYRFKVKNYYISAFPGSLNSTSTVSSASKTKSEGGGGDSGGGGDQGTDNSTGQTLKTESKINQIQEITTYIRSMLSPNGRMSIMESTGIVTVRDTPMVHESIEKSIRELNAVLSKQIHVNLEVFTIETNESDTAGIDWNLAWASAGGRNNFGYQSLTNTTGLNTGTIGILTGPFSGTSIKVGLEAAIGRVVNGTSGSVVTQNGKITPIILANAQEYIRSITASNTASGNSTSAVTYTATPATATTGLDAKVQARIQPDGRILLKLNMNMSELKELTTFQVGSGSGASSVQLANTDLRNIEQEITLKSGQALVLSGFKQFRNKKANSGTGNPYNMLFGGGSREATAKDVQLVIVATPFLVENPD